MPREQLVLLLLRMYILKYPLHLFLIDLIKTFHLQALFQNLLKLREKSLDQGLRARWTTGYILIDGYNCINALNGVVTIIEFTTRICTYNPVVLSP